MHVSKTVKSSVWFVPRKRRYSGFHAYNQNSGFWLRQLQTLGANHAESCSDLAVEAEVIEMTDYRDIAANNILSTPSLVVNEKLVCAGLIPTSAEVITWLTNALS